MLDGGAEIETPPHGLGEVGGASSRDDTACARRPRSVEADREDVVSRPARDLQGEIHRLPDRLDRRRRALVDAARRLRHPVDQERARLVEHGGVGLRAADIEPDDDGVVVLR